LEGDDALPHNRNCRGENRGEDALWCGEKDTSECFLRTDKGRGFFTKGLGKRGEKGRCRRRGSTFEKTTSKDELISIKKKKANEIKEGKEGKRSFLKKEACPGRGRRIRYRGKINKSRGKRKKLRPQKKGRAV